MKKLLAFILVAMMLIGLVACDEVETTKQPAADSSHMKVGLAMHNQSETWAVQFADSFKEAAEEKGAEVLLTDANANVSDQVSQIEDLVAQDIDVLVVLPADFTALGNALKVAKDAGVKIVNADSKVDEADQDLVDCFVTADAYGAGYALGEYLANRLPENAVVGYINFSVLSVIADRFVGATDALNKNGRTDVTYVEKDANDLSAIATYTEDMLMSNPEIHTFVCLNDNTALTCYGTCAQMDHPEIEVYGFDGSPAGKQSIAAGEMQGTMVYSPVDMAKTSFEAAYKLFKGEEIDKETTVDMWLIDPENINDYDLDNWS